MITDQPTEFSAARVRAALTALLSVVFLVVLVRTAWISDDALISLRTVLNVTHGYGLTFNIYERVQTFTHPLWLLLLTLGYLVTGHIYVATFIVSIVCSFVLFWLALTRAVTPAQAALAAIALLCSRAFVDFSTSGLENPLLALLVVALVSLFLNETRDRRRWLTTLWWVAALLYLTRPDGVIFAMPFLAVAHWRVWSGGLTHTTADRTGHGGLGHLTSFLIGTLPASLWTMFSILYYGFPFPNTAYAKLAMGIPASDLWVQGVLYLVDSLDRDPITLTVIAFAVVLAIVQRGTAPRAIAAAITLYLLYIISIGGDFMTGRFLSVPFYAAVLLLTQLASGPALAFWVPATAVVALMGTAGLGLPLQSNSKHTEPWDKSAGVTDERAVYFRAKSLLFASRDTFRDPEWPRGGKLPFGPVRVMNTCGLMGTSGLDQGPFVHLLDECALADPLLARLPTVYNPGWRVGHYRRTVPAGYGEGLNTRSNQLVDPKLHEYYGHLLTIIRSDRLLASDRLWTILAMNVGRYNDLIDRTFYRFEGSVTTLDQVAAVKAEGTPWNAEGNRLLTKPLAIVLPDKRGRRYFDISLDSDDAYRVSFLKGAKTISAIDLGPIPEYRRKPGLYVYTPDVPPAAREKGFDTIHVSALSGNKEFAMGHLLVEGFPATDELLHRKIAERDGMVRK